MYTKGGWEVKVNHLPSANYSRTLVFCNGKEIANCNHSQLSKEDQESHAHLIAAAPDLLEACKKILENMEQPAVLAQGDWQTGMFCGLEDIGITDRYDACMYGHECALEKVWEWVISGLDEAIALAEKEQ